MLANRLYLKLFSVAIILVFLVSILTFYWAISTPPILTFSVDFRLPDSFIDLNGAINLRTEPDVKFLTSSGDKNLKIESLSTVSPTSLIIKDNNDKFRYHHEQPKENSDHTSNNPVHHSQSTNKKRQSSGNGDLLTTEHEIKQRIEKVSELCKKYHLGRYQWSNGSNDLNEKEPPTPLFSFYFWNRQRHLAWCPVYKAGSTSWLQNMLILAGYSEKELDHPSKQLSFMARDAYGDAEPDTETLEQTLKLLVVRHPFERLVSGYKDKLSNATIGHEHGTLHYYKKYGEKIVRKFRKDKTIQQFEPTWPEFVSYLISTDLIQYSDDHWLPAYYSCTPCLVEYDIIAKTETYSRDQEYIIYKAGLEGIIKPTWIHQTATSQIERDSLSKKYFSQLSKSVIKKLYKKYWFDFELFGYDYEDYLNYGTQQQDTS